ncbi:MAG: protoporphyrinogen oxidase [Polyangiaceae bacterium]
MADGSTAPVSIVVAGGGVTGLTTAYRLLAQGGPRVRVTVVESGDRLGGKIKTVRRDGLVLDGGPDAFVTAKPHATALCKDLGLGDRLIGTRPESRRVYMHARGKTFHLPEGLVLAIPTRFWPLVKSPLFSWPGLARMGADLVLPRGKRDVDESIADFLGRRLGAEVVDRLGDPLLGGIYAGDPRRLSMEATFPQLLELETKHRSLMLGALAGRRSAASKGSAGGAPASKPGGPPPSVFYSLRGGLGEIIETLAREIRERGGEIRMGTRLTSVAHAATGEGMRLTLEPTSDGSGSAEVVDADRVVVALPAKPAAAALETIDPRISAELGEIEHVSTATCLLAFDRASIAHPLDAVGMILPKGADGAAMALTFVTSKWQDRAPEGTVVMRVFLGGYAHPEIKGMTDAEVESVARAELARLLDIRAKPKLVEVFRWNDSSPQPVIGHLARMERVRRFLAPHPQLRLAGAVYDGVGIPDCVRQANEAAESILASVRA